MYDGINIMVNQFPILLDAVAYLAGRKLFAKSFLSDLTLWRFFPTGNCLQKVSYPA